MMHNSSLETNKKQAVFTQKKALRSVMKKKLQQLSDQELKINSTRVFEKLKAVAEFKQAKTVFIYLAKDQEVQTQAIISYLWQTNKTILVPKIIDQKLRAVLVNNWQDLKPGKWGILEPKSTKVWQEKIDLSLVPGLAFTQQGERLGRGRGFYDQFLASGQSAFNLALAHSCQILESLPIDSWDQKLDLVLIE